VTDCPPRSPHKWQPPAEVPGEYWAYLGYEGAQPTEWFESPQSYQLVQAGKLPPLAERVPVPADRGIAQGPQGIGEYGGAFRLVGDTNAANPFGGTRIAWAVKDGSGVGMFPVAGKSWDVSDDGKVYTMVLRDGLRWSDGELFDMDDIRFAWNDVTFNKEITPTSHLMITDPITGNDAVFTVINDTKFTITFETASFNLFETHEAIQGQSCRATVTNWYCAEHYWKQYHPKYADAAELQSKIDAQGVDDWVQLWKAMHNGIVDLEAGRGFRPTLSPWRLTEFQAGAVTRLSRNHYFMMFDPEGNQLPYPDEYVIFKSESREVGVFRSMAGENDGSTFQYRLPEMPLYNSNMEAGDYSLYHWPSAGGTDTGMYLNFNYNADPWIGQMLRTTDFRIALSLAIDRDEMNEVLFLGVGTPQNQVPHPSTPYYPGIEFAQLNVEFDPDRANDLLDALMPEKDDEGFRLKPNGDRFNWSGVLWHNARASAMYEMLVPMWEEIGIEFTWVQTPDAWDMYLDLETPMFTRGYDMSPYQANPWAIQWSRLVPARSYGLPGVAPEISNYLTSDGAKGMAPGPDPSFLPLAPADTWAVDVSGNMMKLRELWIEGRSFPAYHPRRVEIGKEIFRINTQEMYLIPIAGFTGNMRGIFLNRNNMLNQSRTHIRDTMGFHQYVFFFEGGKDNANHPDNKSQLYKSFSFLGG